MLSENDASEPKQLEFSFAQMLPNHTNNEGTRDKYEYGLSHKSTNADEI